MNSSSFEEVLARNGRLVYTNVGDSMLPLIREGRDLLVIEPPRGRLKQYDIPLYRRDSGQYVLHRVLEVREDGYVLCWDNRWSKEYDVTDRQIIGVLTGLVRDGKERRLAGWKYRLYVFFWCRLFPLRAFFLKVRYVLKRMMKR